MPHFAFHPPEDMDTSGQAGGESPRHGFQGDRARTEEMPFVPASVTIAVSREAGSRGGSIARRAAAKLGWQVYSQELLEYIAQDGNFRTGVEEQLSPAADHWVEDHLEQLRTGGSSARTTEWLDLARMVLALAAQGGVVLIGRGAGFLLPPRSTLHVRVIAPLPDRIAYMSQWLRLTPEEAAEQVRLRDSRRAEFIATHFQRRPGEVHQYDVLLNSSLLGEDLCAGLIVNAAQGKGTGLTSAV